MKEGIVKLNKECQHCGKFEYGVIAASGPHMRLNCNECGKFIKFVKKTEIYEYIDEPKEPEEDPDILKEINFKLDLILDHLGIRK